MSKKTPGRCQSSLFTLRKELADEACGIRLYSRIRPAVEKLRYAAWSNGVGVGEITAQVFHCLHRAGIGEQRTQFRRHVRDSASIIPQQVEKVVGVLVFPPEVEGERLEAHKGSRAADANFPLGGFTRDRVAAQGEVPV